MPDGRSLLCGLSQIPTAGCRITPALVRCLPENKKYTWGTIRRKLLSRRCILHPLPPLLQPGLCIFAMTRPEECFNRPFQASFLLYAGFSILPLIRGIIENIVFIAIDYRGAAVFIFPFKATPIIGMHMAVKKIFRGVLVH